MSKFLSKEASRLAPYTPGEQPQDQQYEIGRASCRERV